MHRTCTARAGFSNLVQDLDPCKELIVDRCLEGSVFHHDQSRRSASSIQEVAQMWQARLLSSALELGLPFVLQHLLAFRVHRGSKQSGRSDSSSYAVRPMRSDILHGTRVRIPSVSISPLVRLPWVVLSQLRRHRSRCSASRVQVVTMRVRLKGRSRCSRSVLISCIIEVFSAHHSFTETDSLSGPTASSCLVTYAAF